VTVKDIDTAWAVCYSIPFKALPRRDRFGRYRHEQAQTWLDSLPLRPHVRFARMIERAVREDIAKENRR